MQHLDSKDFDLSPYNAPCLFLSPQGYKAQAEMVMERLGALVAGCEARRESIVIEGVHLSPNAVMRLMGRHASVVPFLVYIRYTRLVLVLGLQPEAFALVCAPGRVARRGHAAHEPPRLRRVPSLVCIRYTEFDTHACSSRGYTYGAD